MKVTIAVPAYTGTIHLPTVRSLMTDLFLLVERGDVFTLHDESGNAIIQDARAQIVADFLAGDHDKLVFVDWDVIWERGALLKLLDHGVDVVAGIYPQRVDPINYCVRWDESKAELHAVDGLLSVKGVPTGFLSVSRACLERMTEAYQELNFLCDAVASGVVCGLFEPYRMGQDKLGEDYSFCQRWLDLGGEIWVDPEIRMAHIGPKQFEGHLGNWLRGR